MPATATSYQSAQCAGSPWQCEWAVSQDLDDVGIVCIDGFGVEQRVEERAEHNFVFGSERCDNPCKRRSSAGGELCSVRERGDEVFGALQCRRALAQFESRSFHERL